MWRRNKNGDGSSDFVFRLVVLENEPQLQSGTMQSAKAPTTQGFCVCVWPQETRKGTEMEQDCGWREDSNSNNP